MKNKLFHDTLPRSRARQRWSKEPHDLHCLARGIACQLRYPLPFQACVIYCRIYAPFYCFVSRAEERSWNAIISGARAGLLGMSAQSRHATSSVGATTPTPYFIGQHGRSSCSGSFRHSIFADISPRHAPRPQDGVYIHLVGAGWLIVISAFVAHALTASASLRRQRILYLAGVASFSKAARQVKYWRYYSIAADWRGTAA